MFKNGGLRSAKGACGRPSSSVPKNEFMLPHQYGER
jgi:hypothetical protein